MADVELPVPAERLQRKIKRILATADLERCTAKQVRKELETKFECSLAEHKETVKAMIESCMEELAEAECAADENDGGGSGANDEDMAEMDR